MLDLQAINKFDPQTVGFFRFKKLEGDYLLTNEAGDYIFLAEADFKKYLSGQLNPQDKIYQELKEKLFLKDNKDYVPRLIEEIREKNSFLKFGPSLFILVVTLRCNHQCIYCHASAGNSRDKSLDMDLSTARKIVDEVFQSNNDAICLEFQGGEPLLNWETLKFIITYAREKNKSAGKDLLLRLVSNFSLLDDEKIKFLVDNKVDFCTSLDGDEETHNYNRIYLDGNSYQKTVQGIKKVNLAYEQKNAGNKKKDYRRVGAVITVTRKTLANYKKVIDAYLALGFKTIFLRYLNPYGFALQARDKIWYTADEYIDFYKKALDYILEKNYHGHFLSDSTAISYLSKIFFHQDVINNLDMRSPCGAAIGQLAFNYNGDVYTCDEGRMLARMGEEMFKLGNIRENNFQQLINNSLAKSICLASCTSGLAGYSDNVYQPYLGVCPVYNYSVYNNIFQSPKNNVKYQIDEAIVEYLFVKLKNHKNRDIFQAWVKKARPRDFRQS